MWGEWSGSAIQGAEQICNDLGLEPGTWQKGKTKIFIRAPETVPSPYLETNSIVILFRGTN
jgi:hypothetical protein